MPPDETLFGTVMLIRSTCRGYAAGSSLADQTGRRQCVQTSRPGAGMPLASQIGSPAAGLNGVVYEWMDMLSASDAIQVSRPSELLGQIAARLPGLVLYPACISSVYRLLDSPAGRILA